VNSTRSDIARYVLIIAVTEVALTTFALCAPLLSAAVSAGWSYWWAALLVPLSAVLAVAYLFGVPFAVYGVAGLLGCGRRAEVLVGILQTITLLSGIPLFLVLGKVAAEWVAW
jgi:hypothetical protein